MSGLAQPRRRGRRHRRRLLLVAVAGLGVLCVAVGCTSTIRPPTNPGEPTTVFLLREAMHTGLVLPPAAGGSEFVEFGFGDWSWFALGNDAWYHAFATVLWPTQGALGRRTFAATDEAQLRARVHWAELSPLAVDGGAVRQLQAQLQQQWESRLAENVRRPELGWTFVPYDRSYWLPNNCADLAAEWFEALGCEVSWLPLRTGLCVGQ